MKSNPAKNRGSGLELGLRLAGAGLVDLYRAVISPMVMALFGPACRFEPSCSRYAREAILTHGLARGAVMAAVRLARCHPLGGHGFDPVPSGKSTKKTSNQKPHLESEAPERRSLAEPAWGRAWQSR